MVVQVIPVSSGFAFHGATAVEPHVDADASRNELRNDYGGVTTSSRIDERMGGLWECQERSVEFLPTAPDSDQLHLRKSGAVISLLDSARSVMVGSVVAYIWPSGAQRTSGVTPVSLADAIARGAGRRRGERTVQDSARGGDRQHHGERERKRCAEHV